MSKKSEWILYKTQKVSLIVLRQAKEQLHPHPIPFNKFVANRNLQKPDSVDFVI